MVARHSALAFNRPLDEFVGESVAGIGDADVDVVSERFNNPLLQRRDAIGGAPRRELLGEAIPLQQVDGKPAGVDLLRHLEVAQLHQQLADGRLNRRRIGKLHRRPRRVAQRRREQILELSQPTATCRRHAGHRVPERPRYLGGVDADARLLRDVDHVER